LRDILTLVASDSRSRINPPTKQLNLEGLLIHDCIFARESANSDAILKCWKFMRGCRVANLRHFPENSARFKLFA